jgi:hypothetical protein
VADHVFGYGSLAGEADDAVPCRLRGWRREWGVAMDNAVAIPGYKRYRDGEGRFPDVCVAFLDVQPAAGAAVDGVCLAAADLGALDDRERNYARVEVTDAVEGAPPGRVWVYAGRPDSRERLRAARAAGRAVVVRGYADRVARFAVPHDLPVLDLQRVDLP